MTRTMDATIDNLHRCLGLESDGKGAKARPGTWESNLHTEPGQDLMKREAFDDANVPVGNQAGLFLMHDKQPPLIYRTLNRHLTPAQRPRLIIRMTSITGIYQAMFH